MPSAPRAGWLLLVALGTGVVLGGCDTRLTPFAEDTGLYSVYGFLSDSGPHFIRVTDLNTPPVPDSTRTLDATVRLENLKTGTTETLVDSVVAFDGVYTHNFRMTQPVVPGATYRLTVTRGDGRRAAATATMPRRTRVAVDPPSADTLDCTGQILLDFQNVRAESPVTLSVGLTWSGARRWVEVGRVDRSVGFIPSGLVEDAVPGYALRELSEREYCEVLDEHELRFAYTHFGPDWPADSVLADPTASRIRNGLGVFGGFRRDTLRRYVHIE
jgi:hypothetical protein